jgi:hypothetical protein
MQGEHAVPFVLHRAQHREDREPIGPKGPEKAVLGLTTLEKSGRLKQTGRMREKLNQFTEIERARGPGWVFAHPR